MTPELRAALALTAFAIAAGGLFVARASGASAAYPGEPDLQVSSSTADQVTLAFLGDTLLADGSQQRLDSEGYHWPLDKVQHLLDADVVVANAEGPITDLALPADPNKTYSYNMRPAAAFALAGAGIDVLGLANNHSMDRGADGLRDTRVATQDAGMATYGAGNSITEAEAPLMLETEAGRVALVGMGKDFGYNSTARAEKPGIPVLSERQARQSASRARAAGADVVIATVHWGENYQPVDDSQRAYARTLEQAGFDAVVGTGSHTTQPIEVIHGMPVIYSLGNFTFGTPGRFASFSAVGRGLVATLVLPVRGQASLELRCIRTDNKEVDYQPEPCSSTESEELFGYVNSSIKTDADNVGTLDLPGFGGLR